MWQADDGVETAFPSFLAAFDGKVVDHAARGDGRQFAIAALGLAGLSCDCARPSRFWLLSITFLAALAHGFGAGDGSFSRSCLAPVFVSGAVTFGFAFQRQFDQAVYQLGIRQAAGFPQLGIHADLGEAGDGVDFVQVDGVGVFIDHEINARHPGAIDGLVSADGNFPDEFSRFSGQGGRDKQPGSAVHVFGFVGVELAAGFHLAGHGSLRFIISQYADFDLAHIFDATLDEYAPVVGRGFEQPFL